MRRALAEVFARHRGLAWIGALNFVAAAVCLVLVGLDDVTVLGANRWIKPTKFTLSVGIYLWSIAWFLPYLRLPRRFVSGLGWAVAITMLLENSLIVAQAVRGTRSHFNFESAVDGLVFAAMGVLVAINTLLVLVLLILFLLRPAEAPRPWLWGIRLGIVLLLVGSAQGGYMIAHGGHTVGDRDGTDGLPFVGWSTEAGDLRPAHSIGLHGLQALPLFAFLVGRSRLGEGGQTLAVFAFAIAWALLGGALFVQAVAGHPMLAAAAGSG